MVRKYDLSCHSFIHDWLRKLGYLPGGNRRNGVSYHRIVNEADLKKKANSKLRATDEHKQIAALKKELEDAKIKAIAE